jgi:hypothetical protein
VAAGAQTSSRVLTVVGFIWVTRYLVGGAIYVLVHYWTEAHEEKTDNWLFTFDPILT